MYFINHNFQRYIIQVVTDKRLDQVKKTYREFQYFNKIVVDKLGFTQLNLNKSIRANNRYKSLQLYINYLNSGYLLYYEGDTNKSAKARELRNVLYTLLYQEDGLFVDGVDD